MAQSTRRPATPTRTGAPEKAVEDARTRQPVGDDERLAEQEELANRPAPRIRQIHGGEVHWFTGERLARETR